MNGNGATRVGVEHTPGPWVAEVQWRNAYGIPVYGGGARGTRDLVGNAFLEADAHRIAALPDLVQCLREHVLYFDCKHEELVPGCCTCAGKTLLGLPVDLTGQLLAPEERGLHRHVAGNVDRALCQRCGHDIRHPIHFRSAEHPR